MSARKLVILILLAGVCGAAYYWFAQGTGEALPADPDLSPPLIYPSSSPTRSPEPSTDQNTDQNTNVTSQQRTQNTAAVTEKLPAADLHIGAKAGWWDALDPATDAILLALHARDLNQREIYLQQGLQQDPFNPVLNMALLEHCIAQIGSTLCDTQALETLLTLESENGLTADFAAIQAYQNGDYQASLAALEKAAKSSVTDTYEWRLMDMVAEVLTREERPLDNQFMIDVMREAESRSSVRMGALFQMCQDQRTDSVWQSACARRGYALSENANSLGQQDFGLGLAMSIADDPESLYRSLLQERNARLAHTSEIVQRFDAEVLENSDWRMSAAQWRSFLDIFAREGQVAAYQFMLHNTAN